MTRRHWWTSRTCCAMLGGRHGFWCNNSDNKQGETMGTEWSGHVKPVRPVPPIEAPDHDDFVAQETARADEIRKRDRELFGAALVKFCQRVAALPELGGELASDAQFAELRVIEAQLSEVMTRKAVIESRARTHIGLYQATTGKPLPAYSVNDAARLTKLPTTEDEQCDNGEDQDQ